MGQIRPDRQTLLFSATMPKKVARLVTDVLTDPVTITVSVSGCRGGGGVAGVFCTGCAVTALDECLAGGWIKASTFPYLHLAWFALCVREVVPAVTWHDHSADDNTVIL